MYSVMTAGKHWRRRTNSYDFFGEYFIFGNITLLICVARSIFQLKLL